MTGFIILASITSACTELTVWQQQAKNDARTGTGCGDQRGLVYFHVDQGSTWPLYRIKTDGTVEERIELGRGVVPVEASQIQR